MGSTASVSRNRPITDSPDVSSDEVRVCETCKSDTGKVLFCNICQRTSCLGCCQHFAIEENPFYHSFVVPVLTDKVHINSSKAFNQKIRCGTVAHHGQLVLLSQLFYQDKYCKCCKNTFKWKLRYQHGKSLYISNRQHSDQESSVFPGDVCFVETKRKLYLTLPCKQMVYKLSSYGENFHEAFKTPLGGCFGITEFNDGLALSVQTSDVFWNSKWQIQFVDFKGNVSHRLQYDSERKALFKEPLNLTSNKDKNILVVSDYGNNSVMAFDASGNLMFRNHGIAIVSPLGVAADMYSNVYVACGKKILQIKTGGTHYQELVSFDIKDKIVSVCIDHKTNILTAISEWGNVTSFKFDHSSATERQ